MRIVDAANGEDDDDPVPPPVADPALPATALTLDACRASDSCAASRDCKRVGSRAGLSYEPCAARDARCVCVPRMLTRCDSPAQCKPPEVCARGYPLSLYDDAACVSADAAAEFDMALVTPSPGSLLTLDTCRASKTCAPPRICQFVSCRVGLVMLSCPS